MPDDPNKATTPEGEVKTPEAKAGEQPPVADKPGGDSDPNKKTEEKEGEEKKFSQADLDRIAAKARDEATKAAEKKQKEIDDAAKQKADEEAGKFEDLYKAEVAKVQALTTKAEAADRYAERINAHIDDEIKSWSQELKDADPGHEDVDARMKWVEKNRNLAKKLEAAEGPPSNNGDMGTGTKTTPASKPNEVAKTVLGNRYSGSHIPGMQKKGS